MVVRRNDRRRRLMNDEFVPTIDSSRPAEIADHRSGAAAACTTRRAYASGADRHESALNASKLMATIRNTSSEPNVTINQVRFGNRSVVRS